MASPANKTTPTTYQEIPRVGTSSSQPKITHAIPLAAIPPIHAIADKPFEAQNHPIAAQNAQASKSSIPPQKEVVKPKRKRTVEDFTVVPSNSEHSKELSPSPRARKPTPKRRKVSPKEPSYQSSMQAPPYTDNSQEEGSNPQEESSKPKRRWDPTKNATPSTAVASE
ncbi:extensin-like [Cryptomeria japonica]|uniref:extensin-like n=1 Tax=Cryptomeria japonica TaxID=3369 RepID=UPI0025AC72EA|nr:extensin-like [Cryptomeria japonica]